MNRVRLLLIWLLCLVAAGYASIRMLWAVMLNPSRAWLLYQSNDQLLNAVCGGNPDLTYLGSDSPFSRPVVSRMGLFLLWLGCLIVQFYALLYMVILIVRGPIRAWVMALSFDQLANAAANGNRFESVSSRANRARSEKRRWGCRLCRLLDWIDTDHCAKSDGV